MLFNIIKNKLITVISYHKSLFFSHIKPNLTSLYTVNPSKWFVLNENVKTKCPTVSISALQNKLHWDIDIKPNLNN